ncbi:MAG: DUF2207 domain-containing protein [Elusimicrobia bacterium]|nr:DUF2207 domain-containing protein [Elusimicrobiota bacterium]
MRKSPLFFTLLFCAVFCAAEEYIKSYDAALVLNKDGSATVAEIISANAEHKKINRGLYRDLPYSSGPGAGLDYKVISLTRNGKTEPYFTENKNGSLRVNFGSDDFIPTGINTYTLTYTAAQAAAFLKNYDEVYWNVTGNYWDFPIRSVSFSLTLPPGAEVISDKISAYSGPQGSTDAPGYRMTGNSENIRFVFKNSLAAREGITVMVPLKKGLLTPPSKIEQLKTYVHSISNTYSDKDFLRRSLFVLLGIIYFVIRMVFGGFRGGGFGGGGFSGGGFGGGGGGGR